MVQRSHFFIFLIFPLVGLFGLCCLFSCWGIQRLLRIVFLLPPSGFLQKLGGSGAHLLLSESARTSFPFFPLKLCSETCGLKLCSLSPLMVKFEFLLFSLTIVCSFCLLLVVEPPKYFSLLLMVLPEKF